MHDKLKILYEEYEVAYGMPTKPFDMRTLSKYHIEDENKSVKWNREFAQSHNQKYLDRVSEMQRERSKCINEAEKRIHEYIMKYSGVSQKGARKIFEFAYDIGHSDGIYSVFQWIESLVELFESCKED